MGLRKNLKKLGKNFLSNPIGTIGAFGTNPLAAQAMVASGNQGTQNLIDYSDTGLAKGLGYATLAAGAYTAAGAGAAGAGAGTGGTTAAGTAGTTAGAGAGGTAATAGGVAGGTGVSGALTAGSAAGWGLTDSLLAASLGMTLYGGYEQNQAAKEAKKIAEQQAADAKALADEETAYYRRLEDNARAETDKANKQAQATKNNMSRGLSDLLFGNNLLGVVDAAAKKKAVLG